MGIKCRYDGGRKPLSCLDELMEKLPKLLKQGDTILVKASHFMHFETIVNHLQS